MVDRPRHTLNGGVTNLEVDHRTSIFAELQTKKRINLREFCRFFGPFFLWKTDQALAKCCSTSDTTLFDLTIVGLAASHS